MESTFTPAVFGRYRLVERIGVGGMAEVFEARLKAAAGTEKVVCIKRILPHLSGNSDFMALFVSEAKIALPLTHGNITQVFDFGEVDGVYYFAMEHVRGQNLSRVLRRVCEADNTLDVPTSLYIASEVCRGLHYAHTYTDGTGAAVVVVHRDVSPHNVLISYNGEVKLTDFGIALAATKADPGENVVRGKPCYLSPEQADGSAGDPRSDIFSMGTVLYEMLSGVRPFEGETDAETLEKVRTLQVDPPSALNADVGVDLDQIVLKAMAKDPSQRYQRAGDLQVDLSRVLHERRADYTADRLASLMKDLYAWELQAPPSDEGTPRDRLLFQLSRAGVPLSRGPVSTEELLQMGTLAIDGAGVKRPREHSRVWLWIGAGGLVVVAAIIGAVLTLRGGAATAPEKSEAAANMARPSSIDPTEHLIPASLRRRDQQPMPENGALAAKSATASAAASGQQTSNGSAVADVHPRRNAFLNCNSWPWSVVYLDGRRLRGNTPLYRVKVSAGRHHLRFVNPELGLSREVNVHLGSGQVKTVAVRLQSSPDKRGGGAGSAGGVDG